MGYPFLLIWRYHPEVSDKFSEPRKSASNHVGLWGQRYINLLQHGTYSRSYCTGRNEIKIPAAEFIWKCTKLSHYTNQAHRMEQYDYFLLQYMGCFIDVRKSERS
ncbi:Krueppel-like factor 15 [Platysternon megacephalum]|uniref:Krueppel-like factor 15 n=1 Tax=Platysternon megacephalum TaxID=55544 RepID=A0A4D9EM48_9SAUR|nr:Krueppel-like factor 15 [Platysternon megacephalum]